MTEIKISVKPTEVPCLLYNMSRFLSEQLHIYSEALKSIYVFLYPYYFCHSIRCILLLSKNEENEIYTFDRNSKIKVILPREKIAQKISESKNYMEEAELHKYKVDLINPAIEVRIAFNYITNQLYGYFVLVCEDYRKYERENKSFGSILGDENYKSFIYPEEDPVIQEKMKEFLKETNNIQKISEILKKNNYFEYRDESDFYENCELLLLSEKPIKKIKEIKEEVKIEEISLETQTPDQNVIENVSTNGTIYDDYDNCCVEDCRQLISNAESFRQYYSTDNKKVSENYKKIFFYSKTNLLKSRIMPNESFLSSNSPKKLIFQNSIPKTNEVNEDNQNKISPNDERDWLFSKINTNEIDEILKFYTKQNTSIDLRTNNSSELSGKKLAEGQEEVIGEEHLFDLDIKQESSYNNLNDQTISNHSVNLDDQNQGANNPRTAAMYAFNDKFQRQIETLSRNDFDFFEIHRNACKRKGYIKDEMKH